MKNHWRWLSSFLSKKAERSIYEAHFRKEHQTWGSLGKSGVSNYSKQEHLKQLSIVHGIRVLVETGTYLGDTIYSLYNDFDSIYSIELSHHYYEKAKRRFRQYPKINLIQGDSGKKLWDIVPKTKEPALFWLDGHYSAGLTAKGDKECPIFEELAAIFSSPIDHFIVIDDARLFVGKNDYPTVDEIKAFLNQQRPNYKVSIENDSIRLLPDSRV
jgi:hypothetical protein